MVSEPHGWDKFIWLLILRKYTNLFNIRLPACGQTHNTSKKMFIMFKLISPDSEKERGSICKCIDARMGDCAVLTPWMTEVQKSEFV